MAQDLTLGLLRETLKGWPRDLRGNPYSPLALAFIGDGVFDLVVRTRVMEGVGTSVRILNKKKSRIVNAGSQARMVKALMPSLSDEEAEIVRRGRNAHPKNTAKNQSVQDYRWATGLEALCGYLYLKGDSERLLFVVDEGLRLWREDEE